MPYYWYDSAAGQWKLQAPAPDPAQVINYSRGADADYDDSLVAQTVDATVDAYGVTMTIAAGNSGPSPRSVNDPAIAYNSLAVGAFTGGGTTDPGDDFVFGWSSRGPTVGGRKKPDLVAIGDGGLADSYYQSTGKLWKYDTGTSYAAPQVGGGAILLAGAGIRDPKVVKTILINSARLGRANPADAMGTQTGWLPDWGWGEMNLDAAYRERLNFARDDIPANGARFFTATAQAGDRATLVWNRRVADCQPLRQGCYYDTSSGFRAYTLSNLDLAQYDSSTGLLQASSASAVDNVEQVRAAAPGSVIYKVSAGDVDGPAGEPFAITATHPLTPLVTPRPTTSLGLDASGTRRSGDLVHVDARVANPSPDLTAENAEVSLSLPDGVELVTGERTQPLGTLQRKGTTGDQREVSWVVRGTSHGLKQLIATTKATKLGSAFRSSAASSFNVDAESPRVTLATPDAEVVGTSIPVEWGATDDSGVTGFDVDAAIDGQGFLPWLTGTPETAGRFAATAGHRYRFRVRASDPFGNVSPYVTSAEIAVGSANPAPGPDGGSPPPATQQPARLPPELTIRRVRWRGSRLIVRGTVAPGATGRVRGAWAERGHVVAHDSATLRGRAFRLTLRGRQPARRRGRLDVTYLGDRRFASGRRQLSVRARG